MRRGHETASDKLQIFPTGKRLGVWGALAMGSVSVYLSHSTNLSIVLVFMAIRKWDCLT